MSSSGGGAIGRREVAVRCFAAEYDDATLEYSESDEERAPNYVVTPTGSRINRLFVIGVLTEVEPVSDDVLRARVVDPTGAFVVYAGQYQPDAKTFLERAEPPQFVAVTGKARTFVPDDADVVYTSVRPESINAVDADTRDRWTVQAAEHTLDRVATCAAALGREERGDALREALLASGVDPALAAGIPRALDHYGTTGAYLEAVRTVALQAAEVVAGERDEVEPLELAPDEGGDSSEDLTTGVEIEAPAAAGAVAAAGAGGSDEVAPETPTGDADDAVGADAAASTDAEPDVGAEVPEAEEDAAADAEPDVGAEEPEDGDDAAADTEPDVGAEEPEDGDDAAADAEPDVGEEEPEDEEDATADAEVEATAEVEEPGGVDDDELYEIDDEERAEIEAEYGTDFATGNEVDEPGEADIETPGPVEDGAIEGDAPEGEEADDAPVDKKAAAGEETTGDVATSPADAADEPADDAQPDEEPAVDASAEDVDLEDAVVAAMGDLDGGDGAERSAVVDAVADEHGADPEAVDGAIQDALMGGRCYEPEDGRLKAI